MTKRDPAQPLTQEQLHVENEHRLTRLEVIQYLQSAGLLYIAAVVTGHGAGVSLPGLLGWLIP